MSTHTPVIVLQSTRPDEVAAWRQEHIALAEQFESNLQQFQDGLGARDVTYTRTLDGMVVNGWETQKPNDVLPAGWRRERDGLQLIVPDLRTAAGKAHAEQIAELAVTMPPAPGLPKAVWGEGFMGPFQVEHVNSRWYACLGFNLKQDQTLVKAGVDLDYWFHAPLSRYHSDRETITRHAALSGAGARS